MEVNGRRILEVRISIEAAFTYSNENCVLCNASWSGYSGDIFKSEPQANRT